jgi:hypothetical protein
MPLDAPVTSIVIPGAAPLVAHRPEPTEPPSPNQPPPTPNEPDTVPDPTREPPGEPLAPPIGDPPPQPNQAPHVLHSGMNHFPTR